MTIEEYSALMGYGKACGMEEYAEANAAYMAAEDMDKQEFCKEWKEHGGSRLVRLLAAAACRNDAARRDAEERNHRAARRVIRLAESVGDAAADLAGREACVRWKLDQGFQLGSADMACVRRRLGEPFTTAER